MSASRGFSHAIRSAVRARAAIAITTSARRIPATASALCIARATAAVPQTARCGVPALSLSFAARRAYSTEGVAAAEEESEIFDFEKVKNLIKEQPEEYIVVDAREPGELVQSGTIPTAINIPIGSSPDSFQIHNEDFEDRFGFERPAKDKTLLFFCKAGVRSHAAAKMARAAGWKTAEYPGSWVDWVAKGGDITHSFD